MTKAERLIKQEEHLQEMLTHERSLWESGKEFIAGVDEVGRGPLAGPVVTAAVILPKDFKLLGVDDSKKLSPKKRDELFDQIKEAAICWSIGRREPQRIDEINAEIGKQDAIKEKIAELRSKIDKIIEDAPEAYSLIILSEYTKHKTEIISDKRKTAVEKTLKSLSFDENLRGENLSLEQMNILSQELKKWLK